MVTAVLVGIAGLRFLLKSRRWPVPDDPGHPRKPGQRCDHAWLFLLEVPGGPHPGLRGPFRAISAEPAAQLRAERRCAQINLPGAVPIMPRQTGTCAQIGGRRAVIKGTFAISAARRAPVSSTCRRPACIFMHRSPALRMPVQAAFSAKLSQYDWSQLPGSRSSGPASISSSKMP